MGTVLLAATAWGSHPGPQHRPVAGEGATPGGVVRTIHGPVSGLRTADGAVEVFAGMPYARPPIGDLRWRPPVPPQPWTEVREATSFGDVPVQPSSSFALRALQRTVDVPLAEVFVNPYPTGEDSLYLNVWRPTRPESAALPVIVTVPGGGFATGSGELSVLDGEPLARRGDVVTVTVNYRLGVFGSNADEASLARAAPPDTDPAAYRADVERRFGARAAEYLRLYPGRSEDEVLDSILHADADRVVHRAMHLWAREHTRTGAAAYVYYFTRVPPDPALQEFGAHHGAELMYAYGTLGAAGDAGYTPADLRLSDRMTDHWVRFAATGDPNGPGLPRWPSVDASPDQVMELGERSGVRPRPRAEAVDFWLRHPGPIA